MSVSAEALFDPLYPAKAPAPASASTGQMQTPVAAAVMMTMSGQQNALQYQPMAQPQQQQQSSMPQQFQRQPQPPQQQAFQQQSLQSQQTPKTTTGFNYNASAYPSAGAPFIPAGAATGALSQSFNQSGQYRGTPFYADPFLQPYGALSTQEVAGARGIPGSGSGSSGQDMYYQLDAHPLPGPASYVLGTSPSTSSYYSAGSSPTFSSFSGSAWPSHAAAGFTPMFQQQPPYQPPPQFQQFQAQPQPHFDASQKAPASRTGALDPCANHLAYSDDIQLSDGGQASFDSLNSLNSSEESLFPTPRAQMMALRDPSSGDIALSAGEKEKLLAQAQKQQQQQQPAPAQWGSYSTSSSLASTAPNSQRGPGSSPGRPPKTGAAGSGATNATAPTSSPAKAPTNGRGSGRAADGGRPQGRGSPSNNKGGKGQRPPATSAGSNTF